MNRRSPFRAAVTTTALVCVGVVLSGCGLVGGDGDVVPGGGAGSGSTTAEAPPSSESPSAPGSTGTDAADADPASEAPAGTSRSGASADPASTGPAGGDSDSGGDGAARLDADALEAALEAAGLSPIARGDVEAAIADPALPEVEPASCRLSPVALLAANEAVVAMGTAVTGGSALVASVGSDAEAVAIVDRVSRVVSACPTSTLTNSEGTRDLTFSGLDVGIPGADSVTAVTSTSTLRDGGDGGAGGGASGGGGSGDVSAGTTETVVNVYAAIGSTVVTASSGPASGDPNGSAEDPAAVTIVRDLVPHL